MVDQILSILIEGSLAVILPLLVGIVVQVFRKYGLQVSAEQQRRLQVIAENAVLTAEEWAKAKIKQNIPVLPEEKFERALITILDKVPGISEDEADDLIHAALPKVGLGATDFLSQLRDKQRQ